MEVTRRFSLAKRKCGMGLVTAKLRETAAHVIAMSVLVLNLRKIQRALLRMLAYLLEILAQNKNWALVQWILVNTMSTSSQKGADSNSPFWVDPDSSETFGWSPVSSTAGNYCSWDI